MAFLIAVLFVAPSGRAEQFARASEAIRNVARAGGSQALDSADAMWLTRGAGLDWPVDSSGFHGSARVIVAIPTRNLRHCLLATSQLGEFGPFGDASYALVDSSGRLLWSIRGKLNAWPAVADDGTAALLWVEGHALSGSRPESLHVEFVATDGRILGSRTWGNRTRRPLQRGALSDVYGFAPTTGRFFVTVNQCNDDSAEVDSDSLYAITTDGRVLWSRGLGAMKTNEICFSGSGDRVAVTDLLLASIGYENRIAVFDSNGGLVAGRPIPRANGADGSVLDARIAQIYAYSFSDGIVGVSLTSGRYFRQLEDRAVEDLRHSDDPETALRAARLAQRIEIEAKRHLQPR